MPPLFRAVLPLLCSSLLLAPCVFGQSTSDSPSLAMPAPAADGGPRTAGPSLTSPIEQARVKIADSVKKMNANDVDGALADLTQALQLKPDSAFAFVLRGSIYSQKKMFPEAEADFKSAQKFDPDNVVIKFNLAELKFMQKHFDEARTGFLPLQKDSDMGDFALYKVYLCDLFAGHEALAKSELDAINNKGDDASYYFGNAAWDLYHKNTDDARNWLVSASHIYEPRKNQTYSESLRFMGYLPLPAPKNATP